MKIVYLDSSSLGDDISLEPLKAFEGYLDYPVTKPEEVIDRIKDADIVIANKVYIGEAQLEAAPDVKLVAVTATGTNNVDIEACRKRGIAVANVVNYSSDIVAQHTFAMILSLSSSLFAYKSLINKDEWQKSKTFCMLNFPVVELVGKTLGIIGYGAIGKRVSHIARSFGMKILVVKRGVKDYHDHTFVDLKTLLEKSDIVTIHTPLTDETRNMITFKELYTMKKTSLLINCARGGIVNETDLARALDEEVIAGAGLDVLSTEPPAKGNPLLDVKSDNLIITPHVAWASPEARQRLITETVRNIQNFIDGKF